MITVEVAPMVHAFVPSSIAAPSIAVLLLACGAPSPADPTSGALPSTSSDDGEATVGPADDDTASTAATTAADGTGDPTTGTSGPEPTGGEPAPAWVPSFVDRTFLCKIVSDTELGDPTENALHTRFNLTGTDLGVPVAVGDALHLLFGDSVGHRVIWPFGEDPDAVGRIPLATVQADPTTLCRELELYVTHDVPSVAAGVDPAIERDFAGAFMLPPPGEAIGDYIADPAGPFPNMPGTFEVPSGALVSDGALYLFYAGLVEFDPRTRATLGYLARWDAPGAGLPTYQIVRPIDRLGDGPLGGHFVQIAPVAQGDGIYLFGTGDYRRSPVSLARIPTGALESGAGTELWDAATGTWLDAASSTPAQRQAIAPVFESEGVGELSVQWVPEAELLVALYQRELHDEVGNIVDNRIILRTAGDPTGPWSDAVTVVDMADPAFMAEHCCGESCPGSQILHCLVAGLYGAYMLPTIGVGRGLGGVMELQVPFLASTWDPYNVVLFTTRIRLDPQP
jgi:hypothetical protein